MGVSFCFLLSSILRHGSLVNLLKSSTNQNKHGKQFPHSGKWIRCNPYCLIWNSGKVMQPRFLKSFLKKYFVLNWLEICIANGKIFHLGFQRSLRPVGRSNTDQTSPIVAWSLTLFLFLPWDYQGGGTQLWGYLFPQMKIKTLGS